MGALFFFLGANPDIAKRLAAEVDSVLGGRSPQYEDVAYLHEARRVITEGLRMYPAGWIFTREVMTDTELGEYQLAKGMGVAYSPYLHHRNPEVFANPDVFDPDRWLPERAKLIPRDAFVPFGGGVHKCIGDQFGLTEITLALAKIASNWNFEEQWTAPVEPAPRRATLTPSHLPMRIARRR